MFEKKEEDFKDLKTENRKKKKEPPKPWGSKERIIVLSVLLTTVLTAGVLFASSRSWKLPGLPRLEIPKFSGWNFLGEEKIIIGNKMSRSVDEEMIKKIREEFEEKTKNLSGIYAFYVYDLTRDFEYGVNQNEIMAAASLIKLPLMLYAQGRVADAKIEAMGKRSDNAVFKELVREFGQDKIQKYIDNLGMKKTSLGRNETTAKEMGDLLAKIYQDKNEKILGFLTDTIFENWLRAGIPQEVRVAHKYGRETHIVNDGGIIFAKRPFILVIMTQGIVDKEGEENIPALVNLIYSKHTQDLQ